ncbi:unnamed protein product, partial [Discosporangium mesarthrocarpum]
GRVLSLVPGTDTNRFSTDPEYRQAELEKAARNIHDPDQTPILLALARETGSDVWAVAAARAGALLEKLWVATGNSAPGTATQAAAVRIEAELRGVRGPASPSESSQGLHQGDKGTMDEAGGRAPASDRGRSATVGSSETLLSSLLCDGRGASGFLSLLRHAYVEEANGSDLHQLELLLNLMVEAAQKLGAGTGTASGSVTAGGVGADGREEGYSWAPGLDRRLLGHVRLVRRLLKAAPAGLNYKRLVGEDPTADPLHNTGR